MYTTIHVPEGDFEKAFKEFAMFVDPTLRHDVMTLETVIAQFNHSSLIAHSKSTIKKHHQFVGTIKSIVSNYRSFQLNQRSY